MPNLHLLARIAEGERSFQLAPDANIVDRAVFERLVCDVQRLTLLGYVGELRPLRHRDHFGQEWRSIEVLPPGITTAGANALRRAGLDTSGEFAIAGLRTATESVP